MTRWQAEESGYFISCPVAVVDQQGNGYTAGYSFAKCKVTGKNFLFFLFIVWGIMPLKVTLVPNYIMLDRLGLLNTYYTLALLMIFVSLGAFIMTQSFKAVPNEIIEAAQPGRWQHTA